LGNLTKNIFLLALVLFAVRARAVSITNNSIADTSLLEVAPSNNNGGQAFVISGHIQNPARARGLYRFGFTGLPTTAIIQSVVLELTAVEVTMGFSAPELGVRTDIVPGTVTRVRLTPAKAGRFQFNCDVFCGSGHEDMDGVIIVT